MISFQYDQSKDIWCLLNKGKSSNNSAHPTKVYELLTERFGSSPSESDTKDFIETYFTERDVSVTKYIQQYQADWENVAEEYHKIATRIFGTELPNAVTAYLTINNRNPYSIQKNMFYVSVPRESVRKIIMHELWHFYTWYGLGVDQEERLGKEKYNDLKEALTVLLNIECKGLFPEGVTDSGYPQHQELRQKISGLWSTHGDVHKVWELLT